MDESTRVALTRLTRAANRLIAGNWPIQMRYDCVAIAREYHKQMTALKSAAEQAQKLLKPRSPK